MKRLAVCFAFVVLMAWPLTVEAGAKAPSSQAATINLVGVNLVSPDNLVQDPYIGSFATVTGTSLVDQPRGELREVLD
jgi:hypothetical protein